MARSEKAVSTMTPLEILTLVGLGVGGITGVVSIIRSLIRGPKEDKQIETDIQDRITLMAERWLERAENRLTETENRAAAAERRAEAAELLVQELKPRVRELEMNLFSALNTIGEIWPWGLNGGGEPRPKLPAWIYEWLHKEGHGT